MADVAITAANVLPAAGAQTANGFAGETLTAGQAVYQKPDGTYWKSQCDGTVLEAGVVGIAQNSASAGQPVTVQTGGTITIGGTVVVGGKYVVSAAAGSICPYADLVGTNYVSEIGIAPTTGTIVLRPYASGVQHA